MLDRLEALSYVERVSDPQDRCAVLIAQTHKDRALEAEYWRVSAEMMRVFYAGLSKRDECVRAIPHAGPGEPIEGRGGSPGEEGHVGRQRGHGERKDGPGFAP